MAQPPRSNRQNRTQQTGDAGEGTTLRRVYRAKGVSGPQVSRQRPNSWTRERKERFIAALRETCNVQESVTRVGMKTSGLYDLRKRDPGFAAAWVQALEESYTELELLMLRHALHGTERIERSDDGKGGERVKTVKSHPHDMAIRLLLAHRRSVTQFRAEQGIDRPGSEEVKERILAGIAQVRSRVGRRDDDGDDGNGGGETA